MLLIGKAIRAECYVTRKPNLDSQIDHIIIEIENLTKNPRNSRIISLTASNAHLCLLRKKTPTCFCPLVLAQWLICSVDCSKTPNQSVVLSRYPRRLRSRANCEIPFISDAVFAQNPRSSLQFISRLLTIPNTV